MLGVRDAARKPLLFAHVRFFSVHLPVTVYKRNTSQQESVL